MDDKIQDRTRSVPGIYAQLTLVSPTLTITDSQQFWFIQLRKTAPEVFDNFCRRTSGTVARWPALPRRLPAVGLGLVQFSSVQFSEILLSKNAHTKLRYRGKLAIG